MLILDTDHLSILERQEAQTAQRLLARLRQLPKEDVCTTIVNFEEQVRGWLASLNAAKMIKDQIELYRRLLLVQLNYCSYRILGFTEQAAIRFQELRKAHKRLGTMDLKIAAIVFANQATLLTRNMKDFRSIPGILVEDWTL